MRNSISIILVKNQEKVNALLNGVDVRNVEEWTQMSSV